MMAVARFAAAAVVVVVGQTHPKRRIVQKYH